MNSSRHFNYGAACDVSCLSSNLAGGRIMSQTKPSYVLKRLNQICIRIGCSTGVYELPAPVLSSEMTDIPNTRWYWWLPLFRSFIPRYSDDARLLFTLPSSNTFYMRIFHACRPIPSLHQTSFCLLITPPGLPYRKYRVSRCK